MQIPIPWGFIAIFISLFTFYYFNKKARLRKQERRERLKEKRQEFLDSVLKKAKENNGDTEGKK
jgi:hypothetical protein